MKATIRFEDDVAIIEPAARVVLGDGDEALRRAVDHILEDGGSKIILDFHRVAVLDSSGIGALLAAQRTASGRGGEIKLIRLPTRVYRILEITEVLKLFDVFQDESEAMESFGSRRA
jgi:anti-sigma B factor antagonist